MGKRESSATGFRSLLLLVISVCIFSVSFHIHIALIDQGRQAAADIPSTSKYEWNLKPLKLNRTWELDQSKNHPLNFVHIPKTGGSSIVKAAVTHNLSWGDCLFRRKWNDLTCPVKPNAEWSTKGRRVWWHTPIQYLPHDKANPYSGYDLFAVIRNPYDRAVSEFYYDCKFKKRGCKGKNGTIDSHVLNRRIQMSLKKILSSPKNKKDYHHNWGHWIPQYDFFYKENGARMVDHILHNELLDDEFKSLMHSYGLNITLPPRREKSRKDLNAKFGVRDLSLKSLKLIEIVYEKDFEIGGYTMLSSWLGDYPTADLRTMK